MTQIFNSEWSLGNLSWIFRVSPTALIIYSLITLAIWWALIETRKRRLINRIPGPKALPIVGNIFEPVIPTHEVLDYLREQLKKYGPIIRYWFGPLPLVFVNTAEYAEPIFSSPTNTYKGITSKVMKYWLGDGLLSGSGDRWRSHRKLITPTFHYSILENFLTSFESHSELLVANLKEHAEKMDVFDIFPVITMCTLDVICETAMGINLHSQDSPTISSYIKAVKRMNQLITLRMECSYLYSDRIYSMTKDGREMNECVRIALDFTANVIQNRKKERENQMDYFGEGKRKKKAFLDLLLDLGSSLSDEAIGEEVNTFLFAGHDTTTVAIVFALYFIGKHPDIQEEVAKEVLALWPKGDAVTTKVISEMKLLGRVVKETLRIFPSVPGIARVLEKDTKFGDYLVPAGTHVAISIYNLHRDEAVFPDPEKFDPDRFLLENVRTRNPYAYAPFSAGIRNCIGQKFAQLEVKTIVASILREYKLESMQSREELILDHGMTLVPKTGIKIRIWPR